MAEQRSYDAGHFSFLELIKVMINVAGAEFAKGSLIRTGMGAAGRMQPREYGSWQELLSSLADGDNPISQFEGTSRHYQDGVFGLSACPFADSIKTYTEVTGTLPDEFHGVTEAMNSRSRISQRLRVGEGAAVSPFCCVHQPIRSELGAAITVGGRHLKVYQLGCKSGAGRTAIADTWCAEAEVDRQLVETILDENMCCYCIRLTE